MIFGCIPEYRIFFLENSIKIYVNANDGESRIDDGAAAQGSLIKFVNVHSSVRIRFRRKLSKEILVYKKQNE